MLEDKIFEDFKQALKARDQLRSSILSFIRSHFANALIAKKKKTLEDNDVIDILRKEVKRHEESIEQFKKGARLDLADKEQKELEIIKAYLPAALSEQEVNQIVEGVLADNPAATIKDMGRLIREVMAKALGGADGAKVSAKVKEALAKRSA